MKRLKRILYPNSAAVLLAASKRLDSASLMLIRQRILDRRALLVGYLFGYVIFILFTTVYP